ncbi:unnamed protein product [Dicrocoelium dendriticum]|nr:unnamed protein product [Dicrocoelium dendriticum]
MMSSDNHNGPETFKLEVKISRASLIRGYGSLVNTPLPSNKPKFNVILALIDPQTPAPTDNAVDGQVSTLSIRSWNPHFDHHSSLRVTLNKLLEFRLVARQHSSDTGVVVGYARLVLQHAAETHRFRLEHRSFELDVHPLPTDSVAYQAGFDKLGSLTVVLNANSRALQEALNANRLGTQLNGHLSRSNVSIVRADGSSLRGNHSPSSGAPPRPPTTYNASNNPGEPSTSASPSSQNDSLPPDWERRFAPNGRPYYLDHLTRTTTWEKPTPLPPGFVGRFIALALFHGKFIDSGFTLPFYKRMLKKKITLEDIESLDVIYYSSLKYIQECNLDEAEMDLVFSVDYEILGEVKTHELKPDGKNIPVTEENKVQYLDLIVNWRFSRGCEEQMEAFFKGFADVFPLEWLQYFDERELEVSCLFLIFRASMDFFTYVQSAPSCAITTARRTFVGLALKTAVVHE